MRQTVHHGMYLTLSERRICPPSQPFEGSVDGTTTTILMAGDIHDDLDR
jgi:hypothetical protein